jgi:hypothetical protein
MSSILAYIKNLFSMAVAAVDTTVPVAVGDRTKIVVLLCTALGVAGPYIPAPYNAAVPIVMGILCASAPVFAATGLVRKALGDTSTQPTLPVV